VNGTRERWLTVSDGDNYSLDDASTDGLVIHEVGDGELRLVGDLDLHTAPILRRRFETDGDVRALDMRDVTFLDSTGLSVLVWANRDRTTGPLALRSPGTAVMRVLQIVGMTEKFRIEIAEPSAD
jgi:anti-anti-sigma factor